MKPASFDYRRASDVAHACELLRESDGEGKLLAGGQSLIAAMNFRLARPPLLIDISHIPVEHPVEERADGLLIAATATQRRVERHPALRARLPVLADAIQHIAHFQIRNKGTVGGSIANADPASELPALSLLLDAEMSVRSSAGEHSVAAEEFFITYMTTVMQPDEMLTSVLFRTPPAGTGWGFHEAARRAGDYAMAGATALLRLDANGACDYARVALFSVAATPVRAHAAEAVLLGERPSSALFAAAAREVQQAIDPEDDVHLSAGHRRRLAETLTARALADAARRASVETA
jgi:aerobic carbon-monoxide dehydrogenase medium subunit